MSAWPTSMLPPPTTLFSTKYGNSGGQRILQANGVPLTSRIFGLCHSSDDCTAKLPSTRAKRDQEEQRDGDLDNPGDALPPPKQPKESRAKGGGSKSSLGKDKM